MPCTHSGELDVGVIAKSVFWGKKAFFSDG